MNNENLKNYLIDLHCLAGSSYCKEDMVILFFQDNKSLATYEKLMYLIRITLRNTGFKITQIEKQYDDHILRQIKFHTNIPKTVWDESIHAYNAWLDEVGLF